jgi:hypothetical protein
MAKGFKTGGRTKGTKNKRTREIEERSNGITPLEYMLKVMRDSKKPVEVRCEMAKAAAPYLHAKRAPENKQGRIMPPIVYITPDLERPEDEQP